MSDGDMIEEIMYILTTWNDPIRKNPMIDVEDVLRKHGYIKREEAVEHLSRCRDFFKFHANSEGGFVQGIDNIIRKLKEQGGEDE
jgi:hypothetical protein